jgi:hypothetical protein
MAVTTVIKRGELLADEGTMELPTNKLQSGHSTLRNEANDRARTSLRTSGPPEPQDADSFSYAWVNERLTRQLSR